jgi:DNA-binding helix-hairpin-helix protein with protein kinase domain
MKNGGTPEANARTQAQAHANVLAFLDKHLGQCSLDFSHHGIVLLVECPKARP